MTRENSAAKRAARDLSARTGMPYAAALRQVMAEHSGSPTTAGLDSPWTERPGDPRLLTALMSAARAFEQGRDDDADAVFDVWMQLPREDRQSDLGDANRFGRLGQFGHMSHGNLRPLAGRLAARWLVGLRRDVEPEQIADAVSLLIDGSADFLGLIESTDPLPGRERGDETGLTTVRTLATETIDSLLAALLNVGHVPDGSGARDAAQLYLDIADAIDSPDLDDPRLDLAWMAPSIRAEVAAGIEDQTGATGENTEALLVASERPVEEIAFMSTAKVQNVLDAAARLGSSTVDLVKDQGAYLMVGAFPEAVVEYFDNHPDPGSLDQGSNPMDLTSESNRARTRTQLAFGGDDFVEELPVADVARSLGSGGLNVHLELTEIPAGVVRRAYPVMAEREALFGPTTLRELDAIGLSPLD